MADHEIAFERGTFRITIEPQPGRASVAAHLALVDAVHHTARPLIFADGGLVEIRAPNEARALGAAIVYLETRYGAPSEVTHAFSEAQELVAAGDPVVVESNRSH
jgi:hypothetical protein